MVPQLQRIVAALRLASISGPDGEMASVQINNHGVCILRISAVGVNHTATLTVEEFAAWVNELVPCEHKNERTIREGATGMLGRVVCQDCGNEREWGAY